MHPQGQPSKQALKHKVRLPDLQQVLVLIPFPEHRMPYTGNLNEHQPDYILILKYPMEYHDVSHIEFVC